MKKRTAIQVPEAYQPQKLKHFTVDLVSSTNWIFVVLSKIRVWALSQGNWGPSNIKRISMLCH